MKDNTTTSRIGDRIRKIRTEKGLSQAQLGERVGLDANRIQQYENGARKPKSELLQKFADALQVSPLALTDPAVTDYVGAMFVMFELAQKFHMRIKMSGTKEFPVMNLYLGDNTPLFLYMQIWCEKYEKMLVDCASATTDEERQTITLAYNDWLWNFSKSVLADRIKESEKNS